MARQGGRASAPKITNSLWKYRRRMEFTQTEVGRLLGRKTAAQVSRYEKGAALPTLVTALKLGIICRVPVEFLFGDLYGALKAVIRAKEGRMTFRRNRTASTAGGPDREFRWSLLDMPETY